MEPPTDIETLRQIKRLRDSCSNNQSEKSKKNLNTLDALAKRGVKIHLYPENPPVISIKDGIEYTSYYDNDGLLEQRGYIKDGIKIKEIYEGGRLNITDYHLNENEEERHYHRRGDISKTEKKQSVFGYLEVINRDFNRGEKKPWRISTYRYNQHGRLFFAGYDNDADGHNEKEAHYMIDADGSTTWVTLLELHKGKIVKKEEGPSYGDLHEVSVDPKNTEEFSELSAVE